MEGKQFQHASVFLSRKVLLPGDTQDMVAFEHRYVTLFGGLMKNALDGEKPQFLHVLAPEHTPSIFRTQSLSGLPRIGVVAEVLSSEELPDGSLRVKFEGGRRASVVEVRQDKPYVTAFIEWVDDVQPEQLGSPSSQPADSSASPAQPGSDDEPGDDADRLERSLFNALLEVEALQGQIGGKRPSATNAPTLPAAVRKFAPPQQGGCLFGWLKKEAKEGAVDKMRRQELFSFAAASVIEMNQVERQALLQVTDTVARLQWVEAGVVPYLEQLRAQAQATKGG